MIGPNFARDLAERLAAVSAQVGGHAVAARLCGVSLSQFKRYVAGRNQPTFETVVRLAVGAQVSLEWVAFGRGRADRPSSQCALDEGMLSDVLTALEGAMEGRRLSLSPGRRAAVVATAYAMVAEEAALDAVQVGRVVDRLVSLAAGSD